MGTFNSKSVFPLSTAPRAKHIHCVAVFDLIQSSSKRISAFKTYRGKRRSDPQKNRGKGLPLLFQNVFIDLHRLQMVGVTELLFRRSISIRAEQTIETCPIMTKGKIT